MHQLNARQREAVCYLDGPLLVLAGAGSGKTRVITRKIAYLAEDCGFSPAYIAAITFTNKAAKEMRERVGKALDAQKVSALQISTFHSLGVRILREEARYLGYKPGFSIFDASDCTGVIANLGQGADKAALRPAQYIISHWKNALISPKEAQALVKTEAEKRALELYPAYEAALKAYQAVDFDDLILLPTRLFEEFPEVREKWQNRLRYLLVDEYQDTNAAQYMLLKQLIGARRQFTAVGDDDQSIYGWRGADIDNLKKLPLDFPNLNIIKLEQNYRSTTRILSAANSVIAHNEKLFEKKLWSDLGYGEPVSVTACPNQESEAESVAMRLSAHKFEHRGRWSDYAVLYRSNHLSQPLEQQLRNHCIPYRISGGQSFFDKAEIRDISAYLRLLANPEDDPAFIRAATTPKRGIGAATLQALGGYAGQRHVALFEAALETGFTHLLPARQLAPLLDFCHFVSRMKSRAEHEPVGQVLSSLLSSIHYEDFLYDTEESKTAQNRWGNVCEFTDWLAQKSGEEGKNLSELVQNMTLTSLLDKTEGEEDADAVRLSTLHAAKGLEYPHVFLVDVEEGILPHRESVEAGQVEEERRLMYVGMTRARFSLHIYHCERRSRHRREWQTCQPSRFIKEIGDKDLVFSGGKGQTLPDKSTRSARLEALKAMLSGGKKP